MRRIPAIQFTYDRWRAGSLLELGIKHREMCIKLNCNFIRDLAVGYTESEKLHVRYKKGYMAVMFFVNGKHFWTHMTINEFNYCFPEFKK